MKKLNFLSSIFAFMVSFLEPLYLKAEKTFTLGIIEGLPSSASDAQSSRGDLSRGVGRDINITVKTENNVIDQSDEPIIDPMSQRVSIPNTAQQKIVNGSASGAAAVIAYFLNEDTYNVTPTNNGSGASTVTNTYNDGWTGLGYNQLARSANSGHGILSYGFTLVYQVTSSGAQDAAGIAASAVTFKNYNNVGGGTMDVGEPLNEGIRNSQYQLGTMTLYRKYFLSCVGQFSYSVPVGDTATMIQLLKTQK